MSDERPASESSSSWPESRLEWVGVVLLLMVAVASRFVGIDHHLRQGELFFDERHNFIDPVLRMWRRGSSDPTVYSGYPGFFNYLIFFPVGFGHRMAGELGAYVAARVVVAIFSLFNVALIYGLARSLAGPWAAFTAGLLLASSRAEIQAAHAITVDVLIVTMALIMVWLLRGPRLRSLLYAGICVGLATAMKYNGLLLIPALAWTMLCSPLRRWAPVVAGVTAATFALAAPYAIRAETDQGMGFVDVVQVYLGATPERNRALGGEISALPLDMLVVNLGPIALALGLSAIALARTRTLVPILITAATATAALFPPNLIYPRHTLIASACWAALAGIALAHWRERTPPRVRWVWVALLIPLYGMPVARSWPLFARYLRHEAADQAAAWLDTRSPQHVLTSLPRLRLRTEPETRTVQRLSDVPDAALPYYDLILSTHVSEEPRLMARGLTLLASFPSEDDDPKRALRIWRPPSSPTERLVAPEAYVSAEAHEPSVAFDGDRGSRWPLAAGKNELTMLWRRTSPTIRRIEIEVPSEHWPQALYFQARIPTNDRIPLQVEPLRPTRPHRLAHGGWTGQNFLVLDAQPIRELILRRDDGEPWAITEVRLFESDQ